MNLLEKNKMDRLMAYINNVADKLAEDAGFGGRHDDGGAQNLRDQVRFYTMGQRGLMPADWFKYKEDFERTEDPEYAKYLELKQKFE